MQATSDASGLYQCPLAADLLRQAPTSFAEVKPDFLLSLSIRFSYLPHGILDSSVSLVHLLSIH